MNDADQIECLTKGPMNENSSYLGSGELSSSSRNISNKGEVQMQLLTVPSPTLGSSEPPDSNKNLYRRHSVTPGGKSHASSPNIRRRSSLAAVKWSAIARRLSIGMGHEREPTDDPEKATIEVNSNVAHFRDLLIHIGQSRDGPELREKIRRVRRLCLDSCRHAASLLLQQIRNESSEDVPFDFIPQLVLLFFCTQLLHRELRKCRRLVSSLPMDMSSYYENRPSTSNFGSVLSQIIICRQLTPDFNEEEICSIEKDITDITELLDDMQEFMPKENSKSSLALGGDQAFSKWARRRRRRCKCCHFNCCSFFYSSSQQLQSEQSSLQHSAQQ